MSAHLHVRPAVTADLPRLQEIEVAAGEQFRLLGMDLVADDGPFTVAELQRYVDAGHVWVAADGADEPVGYLLLDVVDDAAHVEQVTVHPAAARRGIGRGLLQRAMRWATAQGYLVLTLTTFTQVPWNGPYYQRLGFCYLAAHDQGPGLQRLREAERDHGLDAWPRAAMRLDLRT